jgi:lipopolysaccharide transport system ATP-binding protein
VDEYLQRVSVSGPGAAIPQIDHPEAPRAGGGSEPPDAAEEKDLLEEERWGSGEAILRRVSLVDAGGRELVALGAGVAVTVEMDVEVRSPQEDFVFGIGIYHADGSCVYGTNTDVEGLLSESLAGGGKVRFLIASLDLVAGSYRIDAAIHTRNGRAFDYRRGVIRFVVGSRVNDIGIYRPRHDWSFEGGIHFKPVDNLSRNVPAPMAEYIKESEARTPLPDPPGKRRRKKEGA